MRPRGATVELPRVFLGVEAVNAGVLTPGQLRGPKVRRVLRGVYAPAFVPHDHELRCEAAGLVVRNGGQVTGASMATVLGVPLARPADAVQVVVPDDGGQERYSDIAFRRVSGPLEPGQPWRTATLASPCRMAFDLAARVDHPEAVARLDAVARAGLVTRTQLQAWLLDRHDNDVRDVRAAVARIDPRAGSAPESKCRVHLLDAGIEVTPQHDVVHLGRTVARVDLAVVVSRLAIEYDGGWHVLREQLEADRRRLNALHEAGWDVVHVTAELLRRPRSLVDTVRRALR